MGKFKASGQKELDNLIIGLCCFGFFKPWLSFILVTEIQNMFHCYGYRQIEVRSPS
jgi:hypothetical protein